MRTLLILLTLVSPALADVDGSTLRCFTFTKSEVKAALGIKRRTAFACANLQTLEVVGAILKNGNQECAINGAFEANGSGCANVTICSRDVRICL